MSKHAQITLREKQSKEAKQRNIILNKSLDKASNDLFSNILKNIWC